MTKIIMHGCNGRMGQVISGLVAKDPKVEIVAGLDINHSVDHPYPVYTDMWECTIDADVIIDFSTAKAVDQLLEYAKFRNIPLVLCTTGLSEEQIYRVREASNDVAILFSANMSLGVNLLLNLVKKAAVVLTDANFDIEIIERHHNQKVDAPSGTALAFADSINDALHHQYAYTYDRSDIRDVREQKEIGIHAVRGGNIVGDHSIVFAGIDEVIELTHNAHSKDIFGVGAVNAAKFLKGKSPGLYNMQNVIDEQISF